MSKNEPLTVYFSDNQGAELYMLTKKQLQRLAEDDQWDTAEKFKIDFNPMDDGYAPAYLLELAARYGFEVDSI